MKNGSRDVEVSPQYYVEVLHIDPGFCPHWSAVVGSNHHSAFLTTTQLMFNSIYCIFNMGESQFSQ